MALSKKSNFYGVLLSLLMFVSIIALFFSEPKTTGFVVQEQDNSIVTDDKNNNIGNNKENKAGLSCIGDIPHASCSNTKPLYCDNGNLVYKCTECGCNEGETCTEFGTCAPIEKCADGSIYGECSFLNGKFCDDGNLVFNCNLCGCNEGYVCSGNKCVR